MTTTDDAEYDDVDIGTEHLDHVTAQWAEDDPMIAAEIQSRQNQGGWDADEWVDAHQFPDAPAKKATSKRATPHPYKKNRPLAKVSPFGSAMRLRSPFARSLMKQAAQTLPCMEREPVPFFIEFQRTNYGNETLSDVLVDSLNYIIDSGLNFFIYFSREEKRLRREKHEREEVDRKDRQRIVRESTALETERRKKERFEIYKALREQIEAMPQYDHWRRAVLEKFGRRCAVCGSTENLEVDHRYKSFHAIVFAYGITNTIQAYECAALWDINNGAPLCRAHHEQTISSRYRASKI